MLHEYREEISYLKSNNAHFAKIFDEHNSLDSKIKKIEDGMEYIDNFEIEKMKKEKLKLKDEIYAIIIEHKKKNSN